jgi:hypothetical protein
MIRLGNLAENKEDWIHKGGISIGCVVHCQNVA